MKKHLLILLFFGSICFRVHAQETCLNTENLMFLDASWEKANLHADPEFFKQNLSEDFIWVHNHNSMVDSKEDVIKRAENAKINPNLNPETMTRSRVSREVKVIIAGQTAIVTGITVVDRGPKPTTYHFMRTYTYENGKCQLLANHTMAIPEEEL